MVDSLPAEDRLIHFRQGFLQRISRARRGLIGACIFVGQLQVSFCVFLFCRLCCTSTVQEVPTETPLLEEIQTGQQSKEAWGVIGKKLASRTRL